MNSMKTLPLIVYLFLLLSFLGSAFYIIANFSKAITQRTGIIWAILTVLCFVSFIAHNRARTKKLLCVIVLIQIPIAICWIIYSGAYFYIGDMQVPIVGLGAIIHVGILGLGLISIKMLDKGEEDNTVED